MLHDTRQIPYNARVGNGGVSIRIVQSMMAVSRDYLQHSPEQENEDVFYVYNFFNRGYSVANLSDATRFGVERICTDITAHQNLRRAGRISSMWLPFSLHKPFDVISQLIHGKDDKYTAVHVLNDIF